MNNTFYAWLMKQTERDDMVGDLAREIFRAKYTPPENSYLKTWKGFLSTRGKFALKQFYQAAGEYMTEEGGCPICRVKPLKKVVVSKAAVMERLVSRQSWAYSWYLRCESKTCNWQYLPESGKVYPNTEDQSGFFGKA